MLKSQERKAKGKSHSFLVSRPTIMSIALTSSAMKDATTVGAVFNRGFSVWVAVKNRSHRLSW